uniref:CUB domain-containing protein n=1 Tax=Magallana gigas TaxID=29159 RepID=K1R1S3_MAGGI
MDMKTVILLMGLGVLEVMLIVIGALAVRRHRRRGKWKTKEKSDDQERTRNNYKETDVYDEIAIDDIGKTDYESPYKELPEDTALGVSYNYSIVTLSLNNEQVIMSPGYPHTDYERDTNYTWYVVGDDAVEEIFIRITMEIQRTPGYPCFDYLQSDFSEAALNQGRFDML